MSFALKSIELKNIRAHEYFLFEPALEGITAISGENGAGKSTIVDAFAWCLYGTRPSGVRNKNLIKDGVDPKDKPVSIKAQIIIGGIEYVIERKIITAQGAVECNVWGKTTGADKLTQVAGPAVSHVEKFIKSELGMNEKGFLTSVLIQQKQVDQIVSASPSARGAVIEELTGIASITQAIQKTNENTRGLQKAASIFHTGDMGEAKEKVEKQEKVCKEILEKEKLAIKEFKELKLSTSELKKNLEKEQVKLNKRIKLTNKANNLKEQIEFLKKQSEEDLNYIIEYKKKYGTTILIDTKKSKKTLEDKRAESYELKSEASGINKELKKTKEDIHKCSILKGEIEDLKTGLSKLESLEKQLNQEMKELEENKHKRSMLMSEIKHSQASHEHINGKDKNCPVCKSKIEDPEQLKIEIEEEIERFKTEQKEVNRVIKELTNSESLLKENISKTNISIQAIQEKDRLDKEVKALTHSLEELSKKHDLVLADLKLFELEYDKALRIEADKNALAAAKGRSLTVNTTIDKNQNELDKTNEEIVILEALTDRSFTALEKRFEEAQTKLTKISISGKEMSGRKLLEIERLNDYKKNLKYVEDAMKQYNEIAEQINVSTGASAMLSAFKADRIEHSIPTLEFFASDFLSKFTGGAFTNLTVDDKFNTFVTTSEGVIRPVAQLSGGELSSTAIALRLGIAMLLNSSEKNVLILDEVLVSMDEDRSRQIMETISSMTNSQIIFIAHNTDINSVADKTVLVTKKIEEEV